MEKKIVSTLKCYFPNILAIYLFGTYNTEFERKESDVDLALLFDPKESKKIGHLSMSDLRFELESLLGREVDLVNLHSVDTVFQKEIIMADRCIYCNDRYKVDIF